MPPAGKRAAGAATDSPVALIVLDGWGYRQESEGNAIALANTPTWDALWARGARTLLRASGLAVGLPEGQIGNSEVGHLNLGAGRVVMQDLVRISTAVADGSFSSNTALLDACRHARSNGATLHLVGLLGTGGVHAIDSHLYALIELALRERVPKVAIHPFTDGRDTLPRSAHGYMQELLRFIADLTGASPRTPGATDIRVSTVCGRYYAMDRDRRWQRTEQAYRAVVEGLGPVLPDPLEAIRRSYEAGITDEFISPVVIGSGNDIGGMRDRDAVICFNYRSDRMRQFVRALIDPAFTGFTVTRRPKVHVTTMTSYDVTFGLPAAFPPQSMERIVADVLSQQGRSMLKTAETEKYPHVTYFFNGGVEEPKRYEQRVLVPSPKVATYDLMPEMSAPGITDVLCTAITTRSHDFILCNYANADMVGHSGDLRATIRAVETVDTCLQRILSAATDAGVRLLITADHGNAELMIDPATGGPHTAHTTNPVPFLAVGDDRLARMRSGGALCDVGPTILRMLGIERPSEMTGEPLGEAE